MAAESAAAPVKTLPCDKCGLEYPESDGRLHGRKFDCTACASADRMLRRGLGSKQELLQLSPEEQQSFYRKLQEEKKKDNKLNWQTVKACLITTLTTRHCSANENKVNTQYLPLSVYVKQGWEEEVVKACPSEWSNTYGCTTYQVPIKSQTWKEVFEKVQERVLQQEREATQQKGKKSEETQDLDLPKAAAAASQSGKSAERSEKAAAKAKAAAVRKTLTQNQKTQVLAAKCVGQLTTDGLSLQKLRARVPEELPEGVAETYGDTAEKLGAWTGAAKVALQQWETPQAQSGEVALAVLPFDQKECKTLHKTTQEVQKVLRTLLPAPKPKTEKKRKAEDQQVGAETEKHANGKTPTVRVRHTMKKASS